MTSRNRSDGAREIGQRVRAPFAEDPSSVPNTHTRY